MTLRLSCWIWKYVLGERVSDAFWQISISNRSDKGVTVTYTLVLQENVRIGFTGPSGPRLKRNKELFMELGRLQDPL